MDAPQRRLRRGQPFPLRDRRGARNKQRQPGLTTDFHGRRRLRFVQAERLGDTSAQRVGQRCREIEAPVHEWGRVGEHRLDLVGHRQRGQKRLA